MTHSERKNNKGAVRTTLEESCFFSPACKKNVKLCISGAITNIYLSETPVPRHYNDAPEFQTVYWKSSRSH